MRSLLAFCFVLIYAVLGAQETPAAPLPDKLHGCNNLLSVSHFPPVVNVSLDEDRPKEYFWKHNTAVLSVKDTKVIEFGAYLYYNDQWNLRASYNPKQFAKWFNCPKAQLKGGEPYTYTDNWRAGPKIFAGWAMWYFIVEDDDGNRSCGYEALYTSDSFLTQENLK